jgi:hypothetical protein
MNKRIYSFAAILAILLVPAAARAVQFGWQPIPEGGVEYIVQVEPELLDAFRQGGFSSDIPESMQRNLRRIRITVGNAKLPNQGDIFGPKENSANTPAGPVTSAEPTPTLAPPPEPQPTERNTPPLLSPTAAAPLPESRESTFSKLDLPPPPDSSDSQPKSATTVSEAPRPLSSLPFFQSGQVTKIGANSSPENTQNSAPRLNENERPSGNSRGSSPDQMSLAKPALPETPLAAGTAAPAKPWLPLMGALLALFASLGANVYLAWIHQGVRMKYRALVQRIQGTAPAAL